MTEPLQLNHESSAVQKHLEIMQGIITRMADNSRHCKVWCVTLVAATLVLVARTGEPRHALIALVPTLLFLVLDAYYLALEKAFRNSYDEFVDKMHRQGLASSDVYKVKNKGMGWRLVWRRLLGSMAVLPFYVPLAGMIIAAWLLIIPSDTMLSK